MTAILLRLFVKDYRNTGSPAVRASIGKLAGSAGIVCNILLFAGKLIAGLFAGSVSIVADAVNNLSDAASSLVTLLGFRLAQRPADADHPYGHARYEYLSGLIVAVFILFVGAELIKSSVEKIIRPVPVEFSPVTFAVLISSVAVKLWMSVFYSSLGKRIHSTALKAASCDSRNDVVATLAVLTGGAVGLFCSFNIDAYIGLAVALFILYSGFKIAGETVSPLLGKRAEAELIDEISGIVRSHEKVLGIHDLLVHDYGPGQCFASLHAELSAEEDPLTCHDIIDDIEEDVLKKLNVHLVIHYDPIVINDSELDELRRTVEKAIGEISPQLSMHDFRMVKGAKQTKLVFDLVAPYSMCGHYRELKQGVDDKLAQAGIKYATVIRFDGKA